MCLVNSQQLLEATELNPRFKGRGQLVFSLISAYGLLGYLRVVGSKVATRKELQEFHSQSYLEFLHANQIGCHDDDDEVMKTAEEFGLRFDCPLFEGVYDYAASVAGASLEAASRLVSGEAAVAINWSGGWHHGRKDEAVGFCYVNDIVLAILRLLEHFRRVLYVDVDIHHGDGVEDAFSHSSRVLTLSFHKHDAGFFPGTGSVESIGKGRGRGYAVNVPLKDGLRDATFQPLFSTVASEVKGRFRPDVVVMQCGADMLAGDPVGSFSLTLQGYGNCVGTVLSWRLPVLLLGGGGYHFPNTARLWTHLTSLAVATTLSSEIPDHDELDQYGPSFELCVWPGNRPDENTSKTLDETVRTISGNLSTIDTK